ncbi:MAG: ATP-binding protein [Acidobacteria bacterium]|nr:ATP-binding protein [Acidobacteriota bacterium]
MSTLSDDSFLKTAGRILNSGQSRTLIFTGNIHDLFRQSQVDSTEYVPLQQLLCTKWQVPQRILIVYELNGPIRFVSESDRDKVREAWLRWRTGLDSNDLAIKTMLSPTREQSRLDQLGRSFDSNLTSAIGKPTLALEMLRQICLCSRTILDGKPILSQDLIILIEAADMLIPEGEISRLSDADRHRVSICHDWFSDPEFARHSDAVILLAESRSLLNQRVAMLPPVLEINIPAPGHEDRLAFIRWFQERQEPGQSLRLWSTDDELARFTAGLSIHALMQLLKGAVHEKRPIGLTDVVAKVEEFIQRQLGEDIVEFKKPSHTLEQVVGFTHLKDFLRRELIPRFLSTGTDALPGAAVCGPIGSGKTFIFEAVANELDMVVLVLKNIRSMWYGQTDVVFERLRRVLDALTKVLIFVDEADTQFGGIGPETHSTERRLTGKIQAMMSDPQLRGRVIWLLMTARIHLLSPDIRRPGRVGDLIIPVLDPTGEDREKFVRWTIGVALGKAPTKTALEQTTPLMYDYSAASFASLRSELKAHVVMKKGALTLTEIQAIIRDHIPPAIGEMRRFQTLQALVNCTRRSLLPDPDVTAEQRSDWEREIRALEAKGIR